MNPNEQKMSMVPSALEKTKDWTSRAITNIVSRAKTYGAEEVLVSFSGNYKIKSTQTDFYTETNSIKAAPDEVLKNFVNNIITELNRLNLEEIREMKIEWKGFGEDGKEIEDCSGTLNQDTLFM